MLLDSEEIRQTLRLHRCRHKACDCHRAGELLATLEALVLLGALTMADLAWWIDNARAQKKSRKRRR